MHPTEMDEKDAGVLMEILRWVEEKYDDPDEASHVPYAAFKSMLAHNRPLTDKQRSWARSIHEQIFESPKYENLVSRGLVPRGREVPTPTVLQNLPKKPPQRRSSDE